MNFSPKEQTFILRGLDKASAETEADICATQLFKLLRERDVNGHDFMGQQQNNSQQTQSEPPKDADGYQFYREGFGWGRGRGRWGKWPDGSTYWEDEHGCKHGPPNPGSWRRNGNGSSATPPPPRPRPQYQDPKWDYVRQQREAAQNQVAEDIINGKYEKKDFKPMIHWGIIIALGVFICRASPGAAVFYMLLVIAINALVLWNTNRSR
jgi:hypothetical protein